MTSREYELYYGKEMPGKESFKKRFENALRVGSVASLTFAPPVPTFSPQEEAQRANSQGHNLIVDTPLSLDGLPRTFEAPDGTRVIFDNTEREQVQSQEVSVFGLSAEFTNDGRVVLSSIGGGKKEINLPPLTEFYSHQGGMEFSPNGTKLVVWRDHRDSKNPKDEGYELFLVSPQTGEFKPIFSDFVRSLDYLPRVIDLEWSQDSKKLRIASGHHGRGKGMVVDIDAEQILFEYRGGIYGKFSPDGNWFARGKEKDLEVRRISDGYSFTIRDNDSFSWSPDNGSLVLNQCIMWDDSGAWGPSCMYTRLSLYNLAKREVRTLNYSEPYVNPFFSPSGEKVFFRARANTRLTHFGVFNLRDGNNSLIDLTRFVDQGFELINWSWKFYDEETILGYGRKRNDQRLYFFWIDVASGSIKRQQWLSPDKDESVEFKGAFDTRLVFKIRSRNTNQSEYRIASITERSGQLEVVQRVDAPYSADPFLKKDEMFAILSEGGRFKTGSQNFLFLEGKRRLVEHEETAEYLGGQKGSIPEGLASFIPEGEKISFRPGDVVGHKDLGIWYLRNGKRYKVQNWGWFKERQRFDRDAFLLPPAILERIPVGEVPEAKGREPGWFDWDSSLKEFQPFGGRMVLFMGGYDSTRQSQYDTFTTFRRVMDLSESRHLYPTYNTFRRNGALFLEDHKKEHTRVHPLESVKKVSEQFRRYKEILPMTKFILVGHSLGGFVLFNVAFEHPDAVEAVITLDSPLAGIDRSFLAALADGPSEIADLIVSFMGSEVGKYLVGKGDDPKFREEIEAKAKYMISRGVKVITATNRDDIFVPEWVSVLDASKEQANELGVQLVWELGHLPPLPEFLSLGGWGEFVTGHGQIYEDQDVLAALIRPLKIQ